VKACIGRKEGNGKLANRKGEKKSKEEVKVKKWKFQYQNFM